MIPITLLIHIVAYYNWFFI